MAEPTVFEMEIEGVVHPIEDKEATTKNDEQDTAIEGLESRMSDVEEVIDTIKPTAEAYEIGEKEFGEWVDGRTVYRRVWRGQMSLNGDESDIQGSDTWGIETLISVSGTMTRSDKRWSIPIPWGNDVWWAGVALRNEGGITTMKAYAGAPGGALSEVDIILVMLYVKAN